MSQTFRPAVAGVALLAFVITAAPASADGPLSIYAGTGVFSRDSLSDNTQQIEVAAGYDLGPKTIVPIRFRADLDYAFDSNTAASSFDNLGVGISARLATPTYFGAGIAFDSITATPEQGGGAIPVCYDCARSKPISTSAMGIGGTFFAGQRLFQVKDYGLAFEASYKFLPSVEAANLSAIGVGLRANF